MKTSKRLFTLMALALVFALTLTACGNQSQGDSKDAGFSMQGTAGDLINNENVFSIAMCYSTATLDDVKAFFTSERFSDPDSFLAEIDALDLDGNIRNLSGDKMSYFDGNTADPIRFYGDGVDLINGTSLLQQAGEYHFYLVTIGYEKVLWVGEADRTFVMEQSAIDLANDFAAAFDLVTETTLMEDQDVSAMTQEEKTQAVQDYFSSQVDTLDLGITVTAEYDDDPDYPDDYYITLAKDGSETAKAYLEEQGYEVLVFHGPCCPARFFKGVTFDEKMPIRSDCRAPAADAVRLREQGIRRSRKAGRCLGQPAVQ